MTTHVNLRSALGRELTFAEGDQNFQNLQQAVDGILPNLAATGTGQGAGLVGYLAPSTGATTVKGSLDALEASYGSIASTPGPLKIPKSDDTGYITEQWIGTDIRRFWSCLAPIKAAGGAGGSLVVIGDSISEGYGASSAGSTSWFSLLRNAIFSSQGENCSDAETVVSFFGLNQYGLTYGGSYAQGTAGPTKQSIILQPGASITFTGNFDYVDVFYTQSASSGTLLFLKDGVQYRSLSTAGSASPDICSFSGATSGGGASHTYTIQASTNPVEITGLIRLQSVSNSNGPQGRIHVSRQALAGVSSSYYAGSAATLASIVAQGSFYRAPSMYIVFLGTNNIYNSGAHTSPAQYEADLRTICDTIKKASADNRIMLCVPPVANEAAWTPFAPWGQYSQAVRRVSADFGTGVIDLGSIDFVGRGLTADGVHPNDAGHYLIYQRVMQSIANYLGVQDDCGGRTAFTPTFGRASGTVTVGYATQAGYYIRTPNICTFSCKIALNSMSSDGSGYLYVTLPFTAQAAFSEAFAIGQHTLAVGSGKQLLCETLPGSNIALLRGFDPVSGAYSEIGALTATSSVVISGTYAI